MSGETEILGSSMLAKKEGTVASTTRILKARSSFLVELLPDVADLRRLANSRESKLR